MAAAGEPAARSSPWENFDFQVEAGVATLTFQRPDRLNALTFEVYQDLRDLLTRLPEEVRVLIITGQGRGFCSGGDVEAIIGALRRMEPHQLLDFTRMTGLVTQRLRECPVPVIAAVNGVAAGAGAVLALASDIRILARSASFAFLFTRVGLSGADMGSAYLLPRIVGLGRATELLMLGDPIDAARALEIGLTSQVVEDAQLMQVAGSLARRLADGPRQAFGSTKMLITRELDMGLAASLEMDAVTQALLMKTADHAEFYEAFRQGRDPRWSGR